MSKAWFLIGAGRGMGVPIAKAALAAGTRSSQLASRQAGSRRVMRGGSWHVTAISWRSAFRRNYDPDYRGISIGFRLVLSVNE